MFTKVETFFKKEEVYFVKVFGQICVDVENFHHENIETEVFLRENVVKKAMRKNLNMF